MKATRPNNWTEPDLETVRGCIRDGLSARQTQEAFFPNRTTESLKRRMMLLRKEMGIVVETNFRGKHFVPRERSPMRLGVLQYTIDDCPRVSLAYACHWAKQARPDWKRPANDRQAWREVNALRLYGEIPVPPFLPSDRGVPDDLPAWMVGVK
jgi:hypothetical protein